MEAQLQELLATIKAEGVDAAEREAARIVAEAEEKARSIVADAEQRASTLVEQARRDRERQEHAGNEALKHAARDLVLSVQSRLTAMFDAVVRDTTAGSLAGELLERAILSVIQAWAAGKEADLEILVPEAEAGRLDAGLRAELRARLGEGAEIKPSQAVKSGFRVASRDGSLYYDFTADAVAQALSAYVGPRLAEVLRSAADGA